MKTIKHLIIPDCQVKPGVPLNHLDWAGKYTAEKRPDVIVCLGDFADMASLSSYDVGKKKFEGRRLRKDIDAAKRGMEILMTPILKASGYYPKLIFTEGNHEERIERLAENDPKLDGLVNLQMLGYEEYGWKVYPFLKPARINGVNYAHYFPSSVMGYPCRNARTILSKYHQSCVAGHQQGKDVAYSWCADGRPITSIIVGSFYQHNEDFLNHFTNRHWRGIVMLHEVRNGAFDEMFVSLNYLRRKYA